MVSDAELVARVRRGDVEAFGQLIERYEKTLLAAVLAESHDIHTAEDVVQATLLLAFRRLETLRDEHKVLFPGYSDRLEYDLGLTDSRLSFDSLQRRSQITEKANRFAEDADFSQRIRE